MAALTLDMVPEQAIELLNAHKHKNTGDIGAPVGTAGIENYAVTEEKLGDEAVENRAIKPGAISKEKLDAEVRELINTGGGNGLPGVADFIADGLEITPSITDLSATVEIGTAWIKDKTLKLPTAQSITLEPRMAALLYAQKQTDSDVPLIGKVNAVLPEPDNNTIAQWRFNQTVAGAVIPNYAVGKSSIAFANNLIPSGGLTSVDGNTDYAIKGDGSTGYYTSANSTGFPIGNSEREVDIQFTVNSITGIQNLWLYGTPSTSIIQFYTSGSRVCLSNGTATYDTGFDVGIGKIYLVSTLYDGTNLKIYIISINGGGLVYTLPLTLTTAAGNLYVFRANSAVQYSSATIHWIEIRNKMRTSQAIAQMANALLLPCTYATPYVSEVINGMQYYDIATSENAISGGDYTSYPKTNTYNKDDTGSFWYSSQQGTGVSGNAFVGQKVASKIKKMRHTNYILAASVSSVKIQWSYDLLAWNDIQTQTLSTAANGVTNFNVSDYSAVGAHYIRSLANTNLASAQSWGVAELAMFTDVKPPSKKDIREIMPANCKSLGRVQTTSTTVKDVNMEYQFGRREKAFGGNRKQFLGWKYFSGQTPLTWENPFGSRKIRTEYVWAQDTSGTNESGCHEMYYNGATTFGVRSNYGASPSARIACQVEAGGAVVFAGTWRTTGYIGCYAEVLEDD